MIIDFSVLVLIVVGLVEVAKRVGLSSRFAPLLAVVLGVLGSFLTVNIDILSGVVAGLTSAGLWDIGKKTILDK